jgi:hypothetical protein
MGNIPVARVLYEQEDGKKAYYILQPGESHDPVTGLIQPAGLSVLDAAKRLDFTPNNGLVNAAEPAGNASASVAAGTTTSDAAGTDNGSADEPESVSSGGEPQSSGVSQSDTIQATNPSEGEEVSTQDNQPQDEVQQPNEEQAANGVLKIETITPAPQEAPQSSGVSGTVTQTGPSQTGATPIAPAVPVAPAAPVTAAVVTPTPVKPAAPVLAEIDALIEKAQAEASTYGKMVLEQLKGYIDSMAPKKLLSTADTVRWQVQLYRVLSNTVNRLDDDFFLVWGTILKAFHSQKDGVFHESYVFRAMEHVTLSKEDQAAFQRLLNLVKLTASLQGRQAATRQVDFKKTLEFGVNEAGKQKLFNFYNV